MALGGTQPTVNLNEKYSQEERAKFVKLIKELTSQDTTVKAEAARQAKEMPAQERDRFKEFGGDLKRHNEKMKRHDENIKRMTEERDAARTDANAAQQQLADSIAAKEAITRQRAELQKSIAQHQKEAAEQQNNAGEAARRLSDERRQLEQLIKSEENNLSALKAREAVLVNQASTMLEGFAISNNNARNASNNHINSNNNTYTGAKAAYK